MIQGTAREETNPRTATRMAFLTHRLRRLAALSGGDPILVFDVGRMQAARLAAALCAVVQIAIITRFLGPHQFGVFTLIMSVVALARQVFESRASALLIRYHARFDTATQRTQQRAVVGLGLLLDVAASLLGAAVVVALSGWTAALVLQSPAEQTLLYLGAVTLIGALGSATAMAILITDRRFGTVAKIEAVSPWPTLLLVITVALVSPSVGSLLWAVAVGEAFRTVLRWIFALRALRRQHLWAEGCRRDFFRLGSLRQDAREITRFALGTNLLATLKLMKGSLPGLYLGMVLSPTEAGFYLLAQRIIEKVGSFVTPTQQVAYPHLARLVVAGDRTGVRRIYVQAVALNLAIIVPFLVVFGPFSRWSVPFLFGSQYGPAGAIITVALVGFAIGATFRARTPLLTAAGRVGALNAAYIAGLGVEWLLLVWFVPSHGSLAAAWALVGFHIVSVAVTCPTVLGALTSAALGPKRPRATVAPDLDI